MSDLEQLIANMTVADLARLGGKTASEIAAYALSGGAPAASGRARNGAAKKSGRGAAKPGRRASASTRTSVGGDFDAKVLAAIENAGEPVRVEQIAGVVGGTPVQRRAALHRLVADKKLKRAGRARATTYEAR